MMDKSTDEFTKFTLEDLDSLAYELPDEIEKYIQQGNFSDAEEAISRWLKRPVAGALKKRLNLERLLLERMPEDFPYTRDDVIRLFREDIPDFDEKDLERVEQAGLAEWIFVNGEKHYIHSIKDNVTEEDDETARRMKNAGGDSGEACKKERPEKAELRNEIEMMREEKTSCRRFRLRTSIRLNDELFYPGIHLKAHLPLPSEMLQNHDVKILSYSGCGQDGRVSIDSPDSMYRTICFEDTLEENHEFFAEYEYTVKLQYHDLYADMEDDSIWHQAGRTQEDLQPYLNEQYPHIRFTPYLKALAEEITAPVRDFAAQPVEGRPDPETAVKMAAAIYDYITTNVSYSYMRDYFLLTDIPQYCARNLRGDCGVQALLFITLCRICGIPARWQSGLSFAGRSWPGAHDWAMFYAEPYGWLYADPSMGGSAYRNGDEARRRFYFGNIDPYRMVANNAFQQPFAVPKDFLPNDPYDSQSGELESERRGYIGKDFVTEKILISNEKI